MQAHLAVLAFFSPLFLSSAAIFRPICKNMFLPRSKGRINCRRGVSKQRKHKAYRTVTVAALLSCFPFVPGLCLTCLDHKAAQARAWSFGFFVYVSSPHRIVCSYVNTLLTLTGDDLRGPTLRKTGKILSQLAIALRTSTYNESGHLQLLSSCSAFSGWCYLGTVPC